jgi:uncharacterized protein
MPEEIRMTAPGDIPIPYRIIALLQERNRLFEYPQERLVNEIRATGFRCDCCGACCTRAVNGHIFLLDHDLDRVKRIDPAACEPAPDPEFCDQNGVLYVSGYALRMKNEDGGSCWFFRDGKCGIYDQRFSGCRIYPYMLRRGADKEGNVTWLKFARKDQHGQRHPAQSLEDCVTLAREIKEYENAYLTQQISFLETIHEYFIVHDFRHDPEMFRDRMQQFRQGRPVEIKVFHAGEFEEYRIAKQEISPRTVC